METTNKVKPMNANEIKNLALTEINHENITDWNDQTNTDIAIINQQYTLATSVALAKYPWSFATKYAILEPTPVPSNNPLKKYKYVASIPNDVVGYLSAHYDSNCAILAQYEIIGNQLYTNQETIYLKYTGTVSETAYTPEFIDWFKTFFAARLNPYLNGDMQRQAYLVNQEPSLFKAAKNIDSKRNKHQSLTSNPILSIRGRFGGGTTTV